MEAAALGVGLARLDRGRGDLLELLLLPGGVPPLARLRHRGRLEPLPHAPRELVHEREEAALGVALDPLGGEDLAALRVLQGRLDADLRPGAHEAADEGGRGLRLARHRLHDRGRHRAVVAVAGLVEQLVEAGRAQHAQAGRLRQVRDQHVGQAGAQPVELRVAGEVVEVEDGHRTPAVLRGGGRLAAEEERGHRRHDHERRADRDGQRPAAPARGRGDEPRAARGGAEDHLARVHVAFQVLEVAAQVARGLVAVLGPLLERPLDHPGERLGDVVAQLAHRARGVLEDRGEDRQVGVAAEGPLPRGHLVEEDAEGEDVGAAVHGQALRLLRGHVGHRPHDAPVLRHRLRLAGRLVAVVGRVVAQLGQPEVEHLEPPVRGQHDVLGLEVPVQDALAVGRAHRVGEGDGEREEPLHREPARRDLLAEGLALDVLHGEEADPVGFLDGVEGHDSGVAERGHRLRLPLEAGDLLRVGRRLGRQHLEGHPTGEHGVLGQVHLAHAPRAERLEDAVRAESPAHEAAVGLRHSHDEDYDARRGANGSWRDICSHGYRRPHSSD